MLTLFDRSHNRNEEEPRPTLYRASINQIRTLMLLKRQSRLKKRRLKKDVRDFHCFVLKQSDVSNFTQQLQNNIEQLPKQTRFQLAILQSDNHWYLTDCYIKDKKLYTFCIDASGFSNNTIQNHFKTHFPSGEHYAFTIKGGQIQYTWKDCQTFTREHASIVSNIDPDTLYAALKAKTQDNKEKKYSENNEIYFNQLADIPIFTKLIRGTQSLKQVKVLDNEIKKNRIVSSSKQKTLQQWVSDNTENKKNISIRNKDEKYATELFEFTRNYSFSLQCYYTVPGLVNFPIISKVISEMENLNLLEIQKITNNLISGLEKAPQYTKSFSFLKRPARHFDEVRHTIQQLKAIKNSCDDSKNSDKSFIVHCFGEVLTGLAGYLNDKQSERTLNIVKDFLKQTDLMLHEKNKLVKTI